MFLPTALMVLAVYTPGGDTQNPIDGLDNPSGILQQERRQESTQRDASPQQQTTWDGTVRDENTAGEPNPLQYPNSTDGRVVIP